MTIKKSFINLKSYLTDWKNLLTHSLLGVGFLLAAIWAPVRIEIKIVIIALLIAFNLWRMNRKKRQQTEVLKQKMDEN